MPEIILPSRWTRQPQTHVEIDRANPLCVGLVAVQHPHTPVGWTNNNGVLVKQGVGLTTDGSLIGSVTAQPDSANLFARGSSQYLSRALAVTYPLTMLSVYRRTTPSAALGLVSVGAGTNDRHLLYIGATDNVRIFSGAGGTTAEASGTTSELSSFNGFVNVAAGVVRASNSREVWLNGRVTGTNTTSVNPLASTNAAVGAYYTSGAPTAGFYMDGYIYLSAIWSRALSSAELAEVSKNPWQIFSPQTRRIFFDVGAAAGTHTTTGALAAQSAVIAGTATHSALHATSGALSAQSATVSGTAVHPHVTSGALAAQSAIIVGVAERSVAGTHDTTGALASGAATIAGSAVHVGIHATTGALSSQAAVIAGTSVHTGIVLPDISRPSSDVTPGGWLPSTGSDLFAMIDEVSADDVDYIQATSATTCSLALNAVADPAASTGHVIKYRAWAPTSGGLVVKLKQSTTVIATWTHATLPTSPTTYTQTLSGAEADSITDYAALRVDFESTI